jgi:hypothetical protein
VSKLKKMKFRGGPGFLMLASLAAVILAALGYLWQDVWLASTQWLLVAAVLALFGVYFKF